MILAKKPTFLELKEDDILTKVDGEKARERAKERMERGGEPLPLTKYDKKDTEMKKVFKEILAGKVGYEDEE